MCVCASTHIIAVQEHWLHDGNLHVLNNVHPDFVVSRPCPTDCIPQYTVGDHMMVGFLVRKTLSHKFKICTKAVSGRCLSATISLDSGEDVNIVTVYFPCYTYNASYSTELYECLSFLEDVLNNGLPSVILGDMNFACDVNNEGFKQCYSILSRYNVFHCDDMIDNGNCVTYCNYILNHSSFLDHMFVTDNIRQDIVCAEVHDTGGKSW